jgi:guanylate kinase
MKHVLMAVSGPAGVGKGTIVKTIIQRRDDVVESVSCTTRLPREGEIDGKHYFFITKEEFLRRIEEKDFLEYDEHFGNYYGTPRSFVEKTLETKSVILEIDVVGALNVKKVFPECVLVMIAPPSVEELKRRLIGRGSEDEESLKTRLARLDFELSQKDKYDYFIVNDDLETAILEVEQIIDGVK